MGNLGVPGPNIAPQQGLNIQPVQQGPLVSVLHTERKMRIYGVTENELRTLTIVNAAMTAVFSLGTGCFGFLLNLKSNAAMAEKMPAQTTEALKFIEPGLMWLGIAFYVIGVVAWFMRGSFIKTIKTESDPQLRQAAASARPGKLARIWDAMTS